MSTPSNFVDLQAGFYNAFGQALGFSPTDMFQIIQPSPPLTGEGGDDDNNQALWDYSTTCLPPR